MQGLWVNFTKDQLFCLLGPNGAGKTTTMNCLTGITPVTGGDGNILSSHGYNIHWNWFKSISLMTSQLFCINSLGLWTFSSKHDWHVRHSANYWSLSTGEFSLCVCFCLPVYFQQYASMPHVLLLIISLWRLTFPHPFIVWHSLGCIVRWRTPPPLCKYQRSTPSFNQIGTWYMILKA